MKIKWYIKQQHIFKIINEYCLIRSKTEKDTCFIIPVSSGKVKIKNAYKDTCLP